MHLNQVQSIFYIAEKAKIYIHEKIKLLEYNKLQAVR